SAPSPALFPIHIFSSVFFHRKNFSALSYFSRVNVPNEQALFLAESGQPLSPLTVEGGVSVIGAAAAFSHPIDSSHKRLVFNGSHLQQAIPVVDSAVRPVGDDENHLAVRRADLKDLRETEIVAYESSQHRILPRQGVYLFS